VQRGGRLSHRVFGTTVVLVAIACCVAVGVFATRTTRASTTRGAGVGSNTVAGQNAISAQQQRAALTAGLTFLPATGATAVAPDAPIVVKARTGRVSDVRVTTASGAPVARDVAWTYDGWQSQGTLAYGTSYRVTATVLGPANVKVESSATFRTLAPSATVTTTSVFPNSGLTLGVGQPIDFRFSQPVTSPTARARLLHHISVTESRPVAGGWHWFSDRMLHFRPEKPWPTGEHVKVAWDLTGWNAGDGRWGQGNGVSTFDIGHARVSYADLATHLMTVTDNGRTVAVYPISGGRPTDPTMGGVHIVLDRQSVVRMNSATNGVPVNSPDGYDELVFKDVHISDTGEYVHAAPWSVTSQGHANVSHGCINLSLENATAYFSFSRVGDIVVVTGSPRPPVVGDRGVMDWSTSWAEFTPVKMPVRHQSHAGRF
jgi:lipoprotein-anchoring transpeptidase ErfK/SrfK